MPQAALITLSRLVNSRLKNRAANRKTFFTHCVGLKPLSIARTMLSFFPSTSVDGVGVISLIYSPSTLAGSTPTSTE